MSGQTRNALIVWTATAVLMFLWCVALFGAGSIHQ